MFKYILLSLVLIAASASYADSNDTQLIDFLEGFNQELNITNPSDFDQCADVPLITDIEQLVNDLNHTIPNPIALVKDVTAIYNDYKTIKTSCPEVAQTYETFFSNFTSQLHNDPTKTAKAVYHNIVDHFGDIEPDIVSFGEDISNGNYTSAGGDFAKIVEVALNGYIA